MWCHVCCCCCCCRLLASTQRETWESIRSRLAPTAPGQPPARVIANLGQSPPTTPGQAGRWQPEAYTTLRAYEALEAAFEGERARDCCVPPGGAWQPYVPRASRPLLGTSCCR